MSLLGGSWTFKDIQKSSLNSEINSLNPNVFAGTFMGHSLVGFGWDFALNQGRQGSLGARAGYELQYWFDQLKFFTFLEGTLHAPLILQGGTLDVHFDY